MLELAASDHLLDGVLARALGFLGFALLSGPVAWSLFVDPSRELQKGHGAFRLAGGVLLLSAAGLAVVHLALAFETGTDLSFLWEVANQTQYGRRVIGHVAFSCAAVVASAILFRRGRLEFPVFFLALITTAIASHSALGHAGAEGEATIFYWSHTVHVTATVLWTGTLLFWLQLLTHGVASARRLSAATAFTRMAAPTFAVILLSGLLNMVSVTGPVAELLSPYGVVLAVKLSLVGGIILVIRGHHRRRLPALRGLPGDPDAALSFERWLTIEVLLVTATLLLAALMSQLPPPN